LFNREFSPPIIESVFSPAARPRWCDVAREVVPRRWAKNVLD
jgi:hypothetical protein